MHVANGDNNNTNSWYRFSFITERVVDVFVRFTSIEWNDKLNDKKSEEFDSKSKMITQGVRSHIIVTFFSKEL